MTLVSKEHYELIEMFEKDFSHCRLDKEPKSLWEIGQIYENGETNNLFKAYRLGCAYGKVS